MPYLHIENLYKHQLILLFKECYALEKIHGTSSHILWDNTQVKFSAGGESHVKFSALFNPEDLVAKFTDQGFLNRRVTVYGEAYGGKQQGMADTYGPNLKFVAFDVCLDEANWLSVPEAEAFCKALNIEFVPYVKISTDLKEIDAQRDAPSVQALRNGVIAPKKREGVVLRPLIDLVTSTGNRVIVKHKGDDFRETASPRVVDDPTKLKVLADADIIANEWVTLHRLEHVLQKIPDWGMEKMPQILKAMVEDVTREADGEIVDNEIVRKAITKKTATMVKEYLKNRLTNGYTLGVYLNTPKEK